MMPNISNTTLPHNNYKNSHPIQTNTLPTSVQGAALPTFNPHDREVRNGNPSCYCHDNKTILPY